MPKNLKQYERKAESMRLLREAYQRDQDSGLIARKYEKKRRKKRWAKRPKVIHKRPDAGLWKWLRLKVWERDFWTCQYCGSKRELQVDHVMPISKGGTNRLKNLVTACRECNTKKLARVLPQKKWQAIQSGIKERYLRTLKRGEEWRERERMFVNSMGADDD